MKAEDPDTTSTARAIELRGWSLFWLLAALVSVVEIVGWFVIDWTSSADIQSLIGFNWRLSTPYFLITFCASSLQQIFPSNFTRWLLANRRYTGLAFSVVAGWQLATISMLGWLFPADLTGFHTDSFQYLEDSIFAVIALMTVTSFRAVNRHISPATWRRIHKTGIYVLASLFFANYIYGVVFPDNSPSIILTLVFTIAWSLRVAVWWRRRRALYGWTLFWALSALTGFAVMLIWDLVGLQSSDGLRLVSRLSIGTASAAFLISFCAAPLRRLAPSRLTEWLLSNRVHFFYVFALNFALYVACFMVSMFEGSGHGSRLGPLPTGITLSIAAIATGLWFTLALASSHTWRNCIGVNTLGLIRTAGMFLMAGLLTCGFLATRSDLLSVLIAVAFALAWLLHVAALSQPGAVKRLSDRA